MNTEKDLSKVDIEKERVELVGIIEKSVSERTRRIVRRIRSLRRSTKDVQVVVSGSGTGNA